MASTEQQGSGSKGDWLRESLILTGVVTLLAAVAGGVFWIQSHPEEAAAGASVITAKPTGTPAIPRATAPAPTDLGVVHADVYFDFKSVRLRADAVSLLQEKAGLMKQDEAWVVLVQGYADRQGPPEYNRALAQRRAEAVKQFLVELGVPETSIKVVTIGQEGALCDDPARGCQRLNRRVHLELRRLAPAAAAAGPIRVRLIEADELRSGADGQASPVAK